MLKLVLGSIRTNLLVGRYKAMSRVGRGTCNHLRVNWLSNRLKALLDLASDFGIICRKTNKQIIRFAGRLRCTYQGSGGSSNDMT